MQVEMLRDLKLFDKDLEEFGFENMSCGCIWFQVFNHGVVFVTAWTHLEKIVVCEAHRT